MAIQLVGSTATAAEVEVNSKALRVTPKPVDYGSLGIYALGAVSGVMAAGLAANAPVFSMRWNSANVCVVKKVLLSVGTNSTTFGASASACFFALAFARGFSASDTGGTAITIGSGNKLRTSMGSSLMTDMRISSTGTLTAGTRTLDTNALGSLVQGVIAGAGAPILAPWPIFQAGAGDYPIVLAANEGLVIQANVPATGTWSFGVSLVWEELTAYVP